MAKYYGAYGSNLNMVDMARRCHSAVTVGTAVLPHYKLTFRGSDRQAYLNVEPKEEESVLLGIWRINDSDEEALDFYEGFPDLYHKEVIHDLYVSSFFPNGKIEKLDVMIYVMNDGYTLGRPEPKYFDRCIEGYDRFNFSKELLYDAYQKSLKYLETKKEANK